MVFGPHHVIFTNVGFYRAPATKYSLYQGYDNIMWYHATVELRLREFYQAMPLEQSLKTMG